MKRWMPTAAWLLALPVFAAAPAPADQIRAGEAVYSRCLACHALAYDRTGPHHCALLGRRAGSVPGFAYSEPMKASDIIWTARNLDRFLQNPARMVPRTTMGYAGVSDPAERSALIAYLKSANDTPECKALVAKKPPDRAKAK
jgi:cytochrome c